jgi:hypothetical protein
LIYLGLVFNQPASHAAGGPTKIEKAKIALIQFQLSPPKTAVCYISYDYYYYYYYYYYYA